MSGRVRGNRRRGRLVSVVLLAWAALIGGLAAPASANLPSISIGSMPRALIAPHLIGGYVPQTIEFDGTGSYCVEFCTLVDWTWNFGDGTTAQGARATHTFTTTGLYNVTLTVTDNQAHTSTATTQFRAWARTQADMRATPTAGRVPLTVAFDSSGSTTNYDRTLVAQDWVFGDGTVGSGVSTTHVYTAPGVYTALLTVQDNLGSPSSDVETIYVQDPMAPPTGLTATAPRTGGVTLRWTNRMVVLSSLAIERCTGARCTAFVAVGGVTPTTRTWTDLGVGRGTTYTYRLKVVDHLGNTGVSSAVSVKTR